MRVTSNPTDGKILSEAFLQLTWNLTPSICVMYKFDPWLNFLALIRVNWVHLGPHSPFFCTSREACVVVLVSRILWRTAVAILNLAMPPIESLTMPKPAVAPSCLLARSDPKSPSLPSRPQKVPEMLQSGARAAQALCVETNKKWRLLVVVQWPGENSVDPDDRGFCSVHLDSQIGCLLLLQALVLQLAGDVLEAHPQPSLYLPLLLLLLPLLHLLTQVQGLSGLFTALPRLDISLDPLLFSLCPLSSAVLRPGSVLARSVVLVALACAGLSALEQLIGWDQGKTGEAAHLNSPLQASQTKPHCDR